MFRGVLGEFIPNFAHKTKLRTCTVFKIPKNWHFPKNYRSVFLVKKTDTFHSNAHQQPHKNTLHTYNVKTLLLTPLFRCKFEYHPVIMLFERTYVLRNNFIMFIRTYVCMKSNTIMKFDLRYFWNAYYTYVRTYRLLKWTNENVIQF